MQNEAGRCEYSGTSLTRDVPPLFTVARRPTLSPMRAPETIDEAELHGWQGLEAHCAACGGTSMILWARLRRVTTRRHLVDIAPRLRCERCGTPPERVSLSLMTWASTPASVRSDRLLRPPYQPPSVPSRQ